MRRAEVSLREMKTMMTKGQATWEGLLSTPKVSTQPALEGENLELFHHLFIISNNKHEKESDDEYRHNPATENKSDESIAEENKKVMAIKTSSNDVPNTTQLE